MSRFENLPRNRWLAFLLLAVLSSLLSACGRNMVDQAKAQLYEASPYFADGTSARPLLEGTVSRERGGIDPSYLTGQGESGFASEVPFWDALEPEQRLELVQRGQERYNIYCAPCHNYNGNGQGMIVQKGFPQPTSFHDQRLRDQDVGYFFSAMTNGFGRMFSYASRIPPEDRWAITAYIRALQLSQNASPEDIPAEAGIEPETNLGATR